MAQVREPVRHFELKAKNAASLAERLELKRDSVAELKESNAYLMRENLLPKISPRMGLGGAVNAANFFLV